MPMECSYLALGDSYTLGQGVAVSDRWTFQLKSELTNWGFCMRDPDIIAYTGWTTRELISAIDRSKPSTNYTMVSLLVGVNNQYLGYDLSIYEEEFKVLLERAIAHCQYKKDGVFVLSIPDYGVMPYAQPLNSHKISQEIDQYNAVAKHICQEQGIAFYDITPVSKRAGIDTSLIALDNLHPSGKMYAQWVGLIKSGVREMLERIIL